MRRDSAKMISSLLYGHNTMSSLRSSGSKAKGKGKLPQRDLVARPSRRCTTKFLRAVMFKGPFKRIV